MIVYISKSQDPKDTIRIENVVTVTDDLGVSGLNIEKINEDLESTEYDTEQFPGLVYRTKNPETSTLIFQSGYAINTGAKSPGGTDTAFKQLFRELRDIGVGVGPDPELRVENIVASADLGKSFDLNTVAAALGHENVEYDPDEFSGLIYRLDDPDVVVLLFDNGKLITTGTDRPKDADEAVDSILAELRDLNLL